ncbi:MAG TPA: glucose-6-phosphate isomerase [Candidatus Omnitrophota bacterium]|nr:glucose-6-phosphate isomerase [Candidatus Omnitrophota bacterium]HPS20811.1 glucose-6-phosphate isomerase [Candidatus Omnitrophota bacterium]
MKTAVTLDTQYLNGFVDERDIESISPEIMRAHDTVKNGTGAGKDFLGWLDLPSRMQNSLADIKDCAASLRSVSDVLIVIGIGGSYLGAKAAIMMLTPPFKPYRVIFAGHNMACDYISSLCELIGEKNVCVNVISKSGTTTEPAIAFRLIESAMRKKYKSEELKKRIVCTTDARKGALRKMAEENGYRTFVIPDDVGGRFSVLTPVGLLPVAYTGIDITGLIDGAIDASLDFSEPDMVKNLSYRYAAYRNILYRRGKNVEILSNFDPCLHFVAEWWKQLFGESEGKGKKGIFPAACDFTTDLHSMGQWIQDGTRNIFETFITVKNFPKDAVIPVMDRDLDELNYLAGKKVSFVNDQAYKATAAAHFEGGVPNMTIGVPDKTAYSLGSLLYFFEKAVAVSAYTMGVNPFDQPGVESYKNKMFKLLGKPGSV